MTRQKKMKNILWPPHVTTSSAAQLPPTSIFAIESGHSITLDIDSYNTIMQNSKNIMRLLRIDDVECWIACTYLGRIERIPFILFFFIIIMRKHIRRAFSSILSQYLRSCQQVLRIWRWNSQKVIWLKSKRETLTMGVKEEFTWDYICAFLITDLLFRKQQRETVLSRC